MKNLFFFSFLLCAFVSIFSCAPSAGESDDDINTLTLQDTISEHRYLIWKSNWKNGGQAYTANTLTEYFTMPLVDITEFLQFPGSGSDSVIAARFELGLDISGTDSIPHLVLVGVNSAGESLTDASRGQYIYDVTKPCPTLCGEDSLPNKN